MQIRHFNIILILLLITFFSCEEEFEPKIDSSSESLIVVDGMISNLPGPYTIKLSLSSKIESPEYTPLNGFMVMIEDDLGNSEYCWESHAGNYITANPDFRGITGRKYKVNLISPEGKNYQSAFEKLREPAAIQSIDYKLEFASDEDLTYDIAGYRFYVSTGQAPVDTNYFMWQLISTFKYTADFNIYWIWEGYLRPVTNYDTLKTCYKTDTLPDIFLLNTENMKPPVVSNFPLHYVTTETRALMERYSVLVRQFSMSKESFKFWRIIKDQNTNLGNLYSKQPFQVKGNVYNPQNPDEIVLGHFMVAGISEKRIFVNRPEPPVKMRYPVCSDPEWIFENFGALPEFPPSSWPIFATIVNNKNALPNKWCMDCRENGGTIEKPDFWIDE
ncbi:MAG: DUF4249 domain-containing protein [Bacteroidales bacterium]|nr:DUF4249 domain-containing protein [Bacteroidales bacterium]